MKYNYECKVCKIVVVIDKPISESGKQEYCDKCKQPLNRVYGVSIATGDGFKR